MTKVLYNTATQEIKEYPRNDDGPVQGLDPVYQVLTKVPATPPSYGPELEQLQSSWAVDTETGEYIQSWQIVPLPNWKAFNAYMLSDATFRTYLNVDSVMVMALFNAYSLITPNGMSNFEDIWNSWVMTTKITPEDRNTFANQAEQCHLPEEFVSLIRGV